MLLSNWREMETFEQKIARKKELNEKEEQELKDWKIAKKEGGKKGALKGNVVPKPDCIRIIRPDIELGDIIKKGKQSKKRGRYLTAYRKSKFKNKKILKKIKEM